MNKAEYYGFTAQGKPQPPGGFGADRNTTVINPQSAIPGYEKEIPEKQPDEVPASKKQSALEFLYRRRTELMKELDEVNKEIYRRLESDGA